jgi:hypothetical protein
MSVNVIRMVEADIGRPNDRPGRAESQQIGPVASFKTAVVVDWLPKTRSGKILRRTIRRIVDDSPRDMPAIFDEIAVTLKAIGYPTG